jgi:parvulin-like peptidyl-prolyl isomerase
MLRRRTEHFALTGLAALALGACQPTPNPAPQASKAAKGESATKEADGADKPAAKAKPGPKAKGPEPVIENVVAKVDGKDIDRTILAERFRLKIERMPEDKRTRQQRNSWLRRVTEVMLWQVAYQTAVDKAGLEPDMEAVNKTLAELKKQPGDAWDKYLKTNAENEESLFAKQLAAANEMALLQARGLEKPTSEDARKYYEENKDKFERKQRTIRASHLEIADGPRKPKSRVEAVTREQREAASEAEKKKWHEDALAYAEYLRQEVSKPGVDFNAFVLEHSEGPGRSRGGDMGIFDERQMIPEYTEAVFKLKAGEISEVLDTSKGIYVAKCFGRYEPGILPFEAIEPDLIRQLEAMWYQEAKKKLREELYKELSMEYGMKEAGGADAPANEAAVDKDSGAPNAPASPK